MRNNYQVGMLGMVNIDNIGKENDFVQKALKEVKVTCFSKRTPPQYYVQDEFLDANNKGWSIRGQREC